MTSCLMGQKRCGIYHVLDEAKQRMFDIYLGNAGGAYATIGQ